MKKYILTVLSVMICLFCFIGCKKQEEIIEPETPTQDYFDAIVLEVKDDIVIAECIESQSNAIPKTSEVSINMNTISSEEVPILNVDDTIRVVYIGNVMETYPLQLENVISIFWIDENGEIITEPIEKKIEKVENPNWGITLTAENITPEGLTIKCTQSAGEPTGELQTGSWYIVENWTKENGWKEMPYVIEGVGWTSEAWIIPMNDTCEWEVNWEWLYGSLPAGKYRIGKQIDDFRDSGNYDTSIYHVEFEITE